MLLNQNIGCPSGFVKLETGCYQFAINHKTDWHGVVDYCSRQNASLVTIETKEEQDVINKYLDTRYLPGNTCKEIL